jgi:prepilin peptidase CpaA
VLVFLFATLAVAAVAAITDLRTGRIPNWLTLGGVFAGILGHLIHGWKFAGLRTGLLEAAIALGGLAFCSLAPLLLYSKGAMGGGDVKLFAAVGALCQPMLGIECQMYSLVIAAVVAPARLAYEGRLFRVLGDSFALLFNPLRPVDKRRVLPREAMTWFRLGPAVFGGALVTLLIHGHAALTP